MWQSPRGYIRPSIRGACSRCGKTIAVTRTSAPEPVCHACRRLAPAPYRARSEPGVFVCPACGREFLRLASQVRNDHPCCSRLCAAKVRFADHVPADRSSYYLARSRARHLRHAQTWDGITDAEILERDGWRCQIPSCKRRPIRKDREHPHPRSKSVDHIIPLSLGGDDTAVNKRAAHLGCNVARGNRLGSEQVALFGVIREPPLMTVTAGERATFQRPERKRWPSCPVYVVDCAHCGKTFTAKRLGTRYCSLKCRNASRFPSLRYCGCGQQLLPGRHKCDACKKARKAA